MEINNSATFKPFEEALTYDDVLLIPDYSEVLPHQVKIKTQLTKGLTINVPIVSAAMDTVTEYKLAIAMARIGGIGMIHKNMSIAEQAEEVRKVKRSESGMIIDPVTLHPEAKVEEALGMMRNYKIGGIPVTDANHKLIGILTNRDLRFETNYSKLVSELMTKENLVTAPSGTTLDEARTILQKHRIEKLPVVDNDYKLVGLITYKDILKVENFPNSSKDSRGRLLVGAAVGVTKDTMERISALVDVQVDVVTVDTAHGHSRGVLETIRDIKTNFPDLQVIGGNVATGAAVLALNEMGADGVKVGIGPGSICTTRIIAGIGVPQLSAVMNCYQAAKQVGIPIIADGGIRYTGDIVKAIAAGADCVMVGSLLAGTEEAPGETIIYQGRKFKIYRGMGSISAMKQGSKDRYFQENEDDQNKLVPEGIEGRVPFKGNVSEVMVQYTGGLRSGMGYCGAADIASLKGKTMVKISPAGIHESHPHNITITKESPNYTTRN